VAKQYLVKDSRNVLLTSRKASAAPDDPELAALPEQMRGRIKSQLDNLMKMDKDQLKEQLAQLEGRAAQAPPQAQPVMEFLLKKVRERLKTLEGK
jgi:hypothetical protein